MDGGLTDAQPMINFVLRLGLIGAVLAVWEWLVRLLQVPHLHPAAARRRSFAASSTVSATNLYPEHIMVHAERDVARLRLRHRRSRSCSAPSSRCRAASNISSTRSSSCSRRCRRWRWRRSSWSGSGSGLTSKVINAALVAFFPLMVNTIVGLRSRRRRPHQPDALAGGLEMADFLDAAAAQCAALYLCRA